jgi:hypothetical protein
MYKLLKDKRAHRCALFISGSKKLLVKFLLESGLFACQAAQEVQLRAADVGVALDHNLIHTRGTRQEGALNAHTIAGNAAHGERLGNPAMAQADDGALEFLDTLAFAFFDADVDADGIARTQIGDFWIYGGLNGLQKVSH